MRIWQTTLTRLMRSSSLQLLHVAKESQLGSPGLISYTMLERGRSFLIIVAKEQAVAQPIDPLQTAFGEQLLCGLADCTVYDPGRHCRISRLEVLALLSYEIEHMSIDQDPVDGSTVNRIKQKRICAC